METTRCENSLYRLLSRFFVKSLCFDSDFLIQNSIDSFGVKNTLDVRQQNVAKSRGFKTLLMSGIPESKVVDKSQIFTYIYNLKSLNARNAQEIENILVMFEETGKLDEIFPILKLLFNIKPLEFETINQLKRLEPEFSQSANLECFLLNQVSNTVNQHYCHPYITYDSKIFNVEPIDYVQKEPYSFSIVSKLNSTHQFEALDVAHCISSSSSLRIGFQKLDIADSKLSLFGCSENNLKTLSSEPTEAQQPDCIVDYWKDVESLSSTGSNRKTWESKLHGEMYPPKELPYLTEAPPEIMEDLCYHWEKNLSLLDVSLPRKVIIKIEEEDFWKDLLYLSLGIESKTFVYISLTDTFEMRTDNYVINGLSADCLTGLVKPFYRCGKLVRNLNRASWNPKIGLVHNTLVTQLQSSLQFHQQTMQDIMKMTRSLKAVTVMVKKLMKTLELLNQLWSWSWHGKGRGIAFLQYLVQLATETSDDANRQLLTAIFAACIQPFLAYLERWMYHGECCDLHGEFLIEKVAEKLERRDRLYWIEGFALTQISGVVDEDNALFGLLDDVYLCGKTVHLLQLCRARDMSDSGPSLKIGLSLKELRSIREECEQQAAKIHGKVDFIERQEDIGEIARLSREAKLAELAEAHRIQKENEAIARSERHAVYKAELDAQLEAKQLVLKQAQEQDRLLDENIRNYYDMKNQQETIEKRQLLLKYANLLSDDPIANEINAAPVKTAEKAQVEADLNANEVDGTDAENNRFSTPTKPNSCGTKSVKKGNTKTTQKMLTRQEIRAKVLLEEFGIDSKPAEPELIVPQETELPAAMPEEIKEWKKPLVEAYPCQFKFNAEHPFQWTETTKSSQLADCRPCAEEIRDLSLLFFVQRSLLLPIRTQCQIVNQSLMKLFIEEQKLMKHLEMLRQFLFLNNGAFSQSLVVNIGRLSAMSNILQLINIPSLNFILQSAVNAVRADEYYASRLSFYIKDINTIQSNSVDTLDCFTLRYRIGWPLNLILTEEVMDDYSCIFNFVLQLRLASWVLQDIYVDLKDRSAEWHLIQIARHSVCHFVQALQNYVMNQLLTLCWDEFLSDLQKNARSLDDLFDIHSRYIHQAKSRLLLTAKSASFMKIIRDTLNLTLKFRSLLVASDFKYSALLESQITALNSKFHEYTKFLHLVLEKVNDRNHATHLNELLVVLNFNDYYNKRV